MSISRRHVLAGSLAAGATTTTLAVAAPSSARPLLMPTGAIRRDPFTLGVASGDPTPSGVVLWTRLALDPLAEDGLGGMPGRDVPVQWQVSESPRMRRILDRGTTVARASAAHSVHVEVDGLRSNREYYYRFKVGSYLSPVGRTRTAPRRNEMPSALAMSFASCSHYEEGYFTAYRYLADDDPDLVLHLGDYQYEYKTTTNTARPRRHAGDETVTLSGYRQRHAQYKTDPDLQSAHAIAPWLVVWDDHETDNNWAANIPENTDPEQWNDTPERFAARRANAARAYYENMPLRRSSLPSGASTRIYRRLGWGRLASFHMLDTRQYRDDQACGDGWDIDCAGSQDPARSITGDRQEAWLRQGFARSRARWDFLGQQVFFARRDGKADERLHVSNDSWDGYAGSQQRVTKAWQDTGVRNPVVLTGDVHTHWAADIKADYDDPDAPVVASELVTTSVTSGGDGDPARQDPILEWNPHLHFYSQQRGYVRTLVTPSGLRADYRSLDRVTTRGGAIRTQATFELTDRERGLQRVR
ncbi:alkaline phosphatase D family protein [Janibacter alkaliphilus]|uniref:Alkaline phosphatase D n=1 Tax=Janibacter alkaliphilus TaxID=1069963 RepID=A0A852XC88_9MICO|nr:alkaline phosphatase D family protein [Janibacter alkaliphilus]NYG38064.1 alkaline phosphatase D [Janibacter alkaliphilus]